MVPAKMYDMDGRTSHNRKDLEAAACAMRKQCSDSSLAGDKSGDDSGFFQVFRRATSIWRVKVPFEVEVLARLTNGAIGKRLLRTARSKSMTDCHPEERSDENLQFGLQASEPI